MFKKLKNKIIKLLKPIITTIENTKKETKGDIELSKKLNSEIERRKNANKKEFIVNIALLTMLKAQSEGFNMQFEQAIIIAEKMFQTALKQGDIDNLYNLIDKKERQN